MREDARRRGVPVRPEKLALAGWTLLVTIVPPALLTLTEAQVLMRLRWQIELLFKWWKEQGRGRGALGTNLTRPRILCILRSFFLVRLSYPAQSGKLLKIGGAIGRCL